MYALICLLNDIHVRVISLLFQFGRESLFHEKLPARLFPNEVRISWGERGHGMVKIWRKMNNNNEFCLWKPTSNAHSYNRSSNHFIRTSIKHQKSIHTNLKPAFGKHNVWCEALHFECQLRREDGDLASQHTMRWEKTCRKHKHTSLRCKILEGSFLSRMT